MFFVVIQKSIIVETWHLHRILILTSSFFDIRTIKNKKTRQIQKNQWFSYILVKIMFDKFWKLSNNNQQIEKKKCLSYKNVPTRSYAASMNPVSRFNMYLSISKSNIQPLNRSLAYKKCLSKHNLYCHR